MQSQQEKVKDGHLSFLEGTLREQRHKKLRAWDLDGVSECFFVYELHCFYLCQTLKSKLTSELTTSNDPTNFPADMFCLCFRLFSPGGRRRYNISPDKHLACLRRWRVHTGRQTAASRSELEPEQTDCLEAFTESDLRLSLVLC